MTFYLHAVEQLLTELILAIDEISDEVCRGEYVRFANKALEKMDYSYRYLYDLESDKVALMITDGFGNMYPARCDKCGLSNHVNGPGWFQCPNGCARV